MSMLFALSLAATASAAPDLQTSLSVPAGELVYDSALVEVTVANTGSRHANNVEVVIQLPETNTSPQVYTMGDVTGRDSGCAQVGTAVVCDLGRVRKGQSATRWLEIALPWSDGSLDFTASASSTSGEDNPADNTDSGAASLVYVDSAIAGPVDYVARHCTGVGLEAFYECTLFPSSISTHDGIFEGDGSVSFPPPYGDYSGSWTQDSDDHLYFQYTLFGDVVAEFEGNGVGGDCFEGLTTFPGSSYVSPYEVCLY
jgi:hypothetical protein